jgi:hypothetical protein
MIELRKHLEHWTDADGAEYELAVLLGLLPPNTWGEHKWVFWSDNPLGRFLHATLQGMVQLGTLEFDAEEIKFRWKPESA